MKKTVVNKLLKMKKSASALIAFLMLFCATAVFGQSKAITGNVTDSKGEPLLGVNITIKGSAQGAITDVTGAYKLNVPDENAVLVFSYLGYLTREIAVGKQTTVNVQLKEDTKTIDEVVVIGYGTVKKSNLTGSISKISDEAIAERPITQLSDALAGQLAGVQAQNTTGLPGNELQIKIRGINSITQNNAPMYVIDGVPRDNMTDLNPSDVASIQVLKDASSSAIYGARGANGVILIETKQGKGKPSVTLDAYYGIQNPEQIPNMMSMEEWRAFNVYYRNENYLRSSPTASMSDPMAARPESYRIPDIWFDPARKGVDWQNVILQNGPIQSYQVSASGSSDMGNLFVSGGYFDQQGVIRYTYYQRFNFRVNGTLNINKHARIGINLSPSFSAQNKAEAMDKESALHHAITMSPLVQLNENTNSTGYVPGLGNYANPLEQLKRTKQETGKGRIFSTAWAEIDILQGLTFRSQFSYNYDTEVYEWFQPGDVTYADYGTQSRGDSNAKRWRGWSIQNTLTYAKTFNNHEFNVLLGQSADKNDYYYIYASKSGWPAEDIPTLNVATNPTGASTEKNRQTTASVFGRLSYAYKDRYLLNASLRRDGSSRFGANNKWGMFPAVSAGWKISEESFLRSIDPLSLLKIRAAWGKAGNDRIGNYQFIPTTATANAVWNGAIVPGYVPNRMRNDYLHWESNGTLDFGLDLSVFKHRMQFNFDYYINTTDDLLFNVPVPSTSGFDSFMSNIGKVENRGWEIDLTSYNTTGIFKWSTSLNLSRNRNKVLKMGSNNEPIYQTLWDGQFITKVGGPVSQFYVYRTDGLLTDKDFTKDANGKLVPLVPVFAGQEPYTVKYVDQWTPDPKNPGKMLPPDGIIDGKDMVPYGNNLPDLMYGFTNRFSYKGLELSVLLQGQFGGKVMFIGQRQIDNGGTGANRTMQHWLHSYKPDYDAKYPGRGNPIPTELGIDMSWDGKTPYLFGSNRWQNNDDRRIYSTTFLKIKNITLSYNLPRNIIRKSGMKDARVYFSVDNLKNWNNYPGATPEANGGYTQNNGALNSTLYGVDYITYPVSKRFVLGINVNF